MSKKMRVVMFKLPLGGRISTGYDIGPSDIIEGSPVEILNEIFDKLQEMGFWFDYRVPKAGNVYWNGVREKWICIIEDGFVSQERLVATPPKEAEPEEQGDEWEDKCEQLAIAFTQKFPSDEVRRNVIEALLRNLPRKDRPQ